MSFHNFSVFVSVYSDEKCFASFRRMKVLGIHVRSCGEFFPTDKDTTLPVNRGSARQFFLLMQWQRLITPYLLAKMFDRWGLYISAVLVTRRLTFDKRNRHLENQDWRYCRISVTARPDPVLLWLPVDVNYINVKFYVLLQHICLMDVPSWDLIIVCLGVWNAWPSGLRLPQNPPDSQHQGSSCQFNLP